MRWRIFLMAPLLLIAAGCATGYTSKRVDKNFEQPKHTLLLTEGLVFEKIPGSELPVLVRDESLNFGTAVASGVCERLAMQGVDCKSVVMAGVQKRDFKVSLIDSRDATNAAPAEIPVSAPARWSGDTNQAAALSSIFSTLDAFSVSAMAFAAPRDATQPKIIMASQLSFSPADFTTLFGRSITSVVVIAEGGALARRRGAVWKDIGVAIGVGIATAIASGGNGYIVQGGPKYPWFVKAAAVDTASGEVLWADWWLGQSAYKAGSDNLSQDMAAYNLIQRCPVFKSK